MSEPRELHPFTLFALPPYGQKRVEDHMRDLRPLPVRVDARPPAVEEAPDPKSHSSATDNAAPFESASSQTVTNELTGSPSASTENPVNVEKGSLSPEVGSSIPPTLQLPGAGKLPVGPTGPTPSTEPPLDKTPSSLGEGSGSQAP